MSVVAFGRLNTAVRYSASQLEGLIIEQPATEITPRKGFPFRAIFKVAATGHMLGNDSAQESLTHRQKAFISVFELIHASEE